MKKEKDWSNIAADFDDRQDYVVGRQTALLIDLELKKLKHLGHTLELGCGNGKYTKILASASKHITATDISLEMIGVAREKLKHLENVSVDIKDCYFTGYPDNSFDTVFMGNLIHIVLMPQKALKEARRVLKPSGNLIIISFTADGMSEESIRVMAQKYLNKLGNFPEISKPVMLADLEQMLIETNFKIQDLKLIGEDTKAMFAKAQYE